MKKLFLTLSVLTAVFTGTVDCRFESAKSAASNVAQSVKSNMWDKSLTVRGFEINHAPTIATAGGLTVLAAATIAYKKRDAIKAKASSLKTKALLAKAYVASKLPSMPKLKFSFRNPFAKAVVYGCEECPRGYFPQFQETVVPAVETPAVHLMPEFTEGQMSAMRTPGKTFVVNGVVYKMVNGTVVRA